MTEMRIQLNKDLKENNMDGLIVKRTWGQMILNGQKEWEIRGKNTTHRGRYYLMYSGMVYGEFDLIDSQPFTEQEFYNNTEKHRLPIECLSYSDLIMRYKRPYKWIIRNAKLYDVPIPYTHPQGAVIWVKDVQLK